MLTVTQDAKDRLQDAREAVTLDTDKRLRLIAGDEGLRLELDSEKPGDTKFLKGDTTILLVDEVVAKELSNMVIDAAPSGSGPVLIVRNNQPNC